MAHAQKDGSNYPCDRTELFIVLRRFEELTLAAKRHNLTEYGIFLKETDEELQKIAMKREQSVVEMSLLNQQAIRSQQTSVCLLQESVPRVNLTRCTPDVTRAVVPSLPDKTIDMPKSALVSRNNSLKSNGASDDQWVLKEWSVMLREDNLILRGKLYKNQHLEHSNHISNPIKSRKKDGTIVTAGKNYILDGPVAWTGKADPPACVKKFFEKKFPICWKIAWLTWRSEMAAAKKKEVICESRGVDSSSSSSTNSIEQFDEFNQLSLAIPRVGITTMTPNTFLKALSNNSVRIGAHSPTLKTFVDDNPSATTVPPVRPSKAHSRKDDVVSMRLAKTIESGQGKAGTKTKENGGKTANKRAIDGIMNQPKNISAKMLKKIRDRFDDSELTTENDSDSSKSD